MTNVSRSTSSLQMVSPVAALVFAALRLKLHIEPEPTLPFPPPPQPGDTQDL
jgi:hypothetical protein